MIKISSKRGAISTVTVDTGEAAIELTVDEARDMVERLGPVLDELLDYCPTWRDYIGIYRDYQVKFCEELEAAGLGGRITHPDYSGRGMYGSICPGATTSDSVSEDDIIRATTVGLSQDSMGRYTILYAR